MKISPDVEALLAAIATENAAEWKEFHGRKSESDRRAHAKALADLWEKRLAYHRVSIH